MRLNKRRDSWYVEFRVLDDGKVLTLMSEGGGAAETLEGGFTQQDGSKATRGSNQDQATNGADS